MDNYNSGHGPQTTIMHPQFMQKRNSCCEWWWSNHGLAGIGLGGCIATCCHILKLMLPYATVDDFPVDWILGGISCGVVGG